MSQTKIAPEATSDDTLAVTDLENGSPEASLTETKQDIESNETSSSTSSTSSPTKSLSLYSDGDLDIDDDELEKLVPVLLEDAADGNLEAVRQVLDLDAKTPNFSIAMAVDDEGRHALHRAALEGQFEIVKLLLERFSDRTNKKGTKYIDVPDKYGNTALFLVCIRLDKSDEQQAVFLCDAGASVEVVKKTDSMTVLHWAAHHGNKALVLAILNHHQKVSGNKPGAKLALMKDKDSRTPIDVVGLQYAQKWVEADDVLRGDSLVEDKRAVSSISDYAFAVRHLSNPGLVKFYSPGVDYWNRCLFWCAATGHHAGVESSLLNGATARWKNKLVNNQTALHMAVGFGTSVKTVELIMTALNDDKSKKPLYKMLDSDANNPLHSFVLGTTNKVNEGDIDGRKDILEFLLNRNNEKERELLESSRNRQGFRPVDYIPGLETDSAVYEMLKTAASPYYKNILENEPAIAFEWVLVFQKGAEIEGLSTQYEKVVKQLRENDLLADIMPSAIQPKKEVFVMVGCTDQRLRRHAEDLQYEVQLLTSREYRKYEVEDDHLFLPFRSQERMEVIMQKMQNDVFDVDAYLECGVLLRTFPLHDPNERELVKKLWLPKFSILHICCPCSLPPFSFCRDLRKEGAHLSFEHLTAIKMYMGEKVAFYYAWYCHYTAYLAGAAAPGLIVLLVQLIQVLQMGEEGLRTPLIPFFCVWMA
jgi:ankyrin repeat protein